jgi:hypothetical protein
MKNLVPFESHVSGLKEKKEWIAKAIKGGEGKLRAQLGLDKDEKVTKTLLGKEIGKLKSQDTDPDKPGAQLPPAKEKKYKRLNLAKTLLKLKENHSEMQNYMFFQNVINLIAMCEDLLELDPTQVDSILGDGHDWATDHIATSKDDVEEVFNFLRASIKGNKYAHGEEGDDTETEMEPELVITDNKNC